MRRLPLVDHHVELTVDGRAVRVPEGASILDACAALGIAVPTFCYAEGLTPINACRVCVVELEGSRVLVPACSRKAEAKMVVQTDSERVRLSRKVVLELLGSSVAMDRSRDYAGFCQRYGADPARFGEGRVAPHPREQAVAGEHAVLDGDRAETVGQPIKIDNDLYVRDYARCILCYRCVEACGTDAQHTFAIAVAGRGFEARIATEFDVALPDSACVYCGACIQACPTGALMGKAEFDMRARGDWDESKQTTTDTICPYCGVGCTLSLAVQEDRIVKVTSPVDGVVTHGNLCVKGRFGYAFANPPDDSQPDTDMIPMRKKKDRRA